MKKYIGSMMLLMMGFASPVSASQMNLDPYFALGVSGLQVDLAGSKATTPAFYFTVGSTLNWVSPNLGAEVRLGFGGQFSTFSGSVNNYTSYLLKPSMVITHQLDIYALLGFSTISMDIAGVTYADTSPSYGIGLAYHVPNESFTFVTELMQYRKNSDQSTTSISGVSISGVSASFVFSYY